MSRDQEIADEVRRAMLGLGVCSKCREEFEVNIPGDAICGKCRALAGASLGISMAQLQIAMTCLVNNVIDGARVVKAFEAAVTAVKSISQGKANE